MLSVFFHVPLNVAFPTAAREFDEAVAGTYAAARWAQESTASGASRSIADA